MDEPFELPVQYNGETLLFPATLLQQGYTHKFDVLVNGTAVLFEPDEEGAYRVLAHPHTDPTPIDPSLLKAIAQAIVTVLK